MKTKKEQKARTRLKRKVGITAKIRNKPAKTTKTRATTTALSKAKITARTAKSPRTARAVSKSTSQPLRVVNATPRKVLRKQVRKNTESGIPAVRQPDGVSCGWATTKWLLKSFGVLDVTDKQLREELNTDAERGVRAWWNRRIVPFVSRKFGKDWEAGEGTLPMAIFSALRKRGIVLKNPVRLERFSNFTDYLYDTFREGGRAAILLWRMDGLLHWMGVDRHKGVIRIMDPARGRYVSFQRGIEYWESGNQKPNFLVFGFVK